jgi:hypothetical protein
MTDEINCSCTEEFQELCALSTAACLSPVEQERLETHVAQCVPCALLLNQYRLLASEGMSRIGAMRSSDEAHESSEVLQNAARIKAKLLSDVEPNRRDGRRRLPVFRLMPVVAAAAMVLLTVGGYLLGIAHRVPQLPPPVVTLSTPRNEATLQERLVQTQSDLTAVQEQLRSATASADLLQARSNNVEKNVNELLDSKAALEATIQTITADYQRQTATVGNLSAQKDALSQKLKESETLLQSVRQELKTLQDERQRYVLRTASLESDIDHLSAQLRDRDDVARRTEQYLASDRDVRELMGARQLYIADVFDVDPQGKTRKPFGRVFYTKGKSLIFYAFDLDQQPGYRDAKAFQAWGRSGSSQATPVSLGIFYLDSESNRRWALKSEDPKLLQEIDALFVTVEPRGGSKRPTNKPFLLAYLHTATANHP